MPVNRNRRPPSRFAESFPVTARLAQLEIETDEELQINLDGEPIAGKRFRFELLPKALPMKLPVDCPLIAGGETAEEEERT